MYLLHSFHEFQATIILVSLPFQKYKLQILYTLYKNLPRVHVYMHVCHLPVAT